MSPTSEFRAASLTKTFVGATALRLVQRGRLHLDDRVSIYVADWPHGDEVTLRQLLSRAKSLSRRTGR